MPQRKRRQVVFQYVMRRMQTDKAEQVLMLVSLLIGLKIGPSGSFQLVFHTLRSAKDVDIALAWGTLPRSSLRLGTCEEGKVMSHKGRCQQQLKAQQDR